MPFGILWPVEQEFIIASWNIGGGHTIASTKQFDYDEHEDAAYFIDQLAKIRPNIICLQESHANSKVSLAKRIQKELRLAHCFETMHHESHIDPSYMITTAILSAFPFSNTRTVELPYPTFKMQFPDGRASADHRRSIQIVNVGPLLLANMHGNNIKMFGYDYISGDGKKLAGQIESVLLANLTRPLIFAGDFNFSDIGQVFPRLQHDLSLEDSVPAGATRPDGNRTDHVLYSPDLQLVESRTVPTASDHYLCWTKLRVIP